MPRIRTIKPEFWTDEKILSVSRDARLFFVGLWHFADDNGVLEYSPVQFKARIFPLENDVEVEGLVEELEKAELVVRYDVDGRPYLWIKNLRKHQKIDRPRKSKLPLPEPLGGTSGPSVSPSDRNAEPTSDDIQRTSDGKNDFHLNSAEIIPGKGSINIDLSLNTPAKREGEGRDPEPPGKREGEIFLENSSGKESADRYGNVGREILGEWERTFNEKVQLSLANGFPLGELIRAADYMLYLHRNQKISELRMPRAYLRSLVGIVPDDGWEGYRARRKTRNREIEAAHLKEVKAAEEREREFKLRNEWKSLDKETREVFARMAKNDPMSRFLSLNNTAYLLWKQAGRDPDPPTHCAEDHGPDAKLAD